MVFLMQSANLHFLQLSFPWKIGVLFSDDDVAGLEMGRHNNPTTTKIPKDFQLPLSSASGPTFSMLLAPWGQCARIVIWLQLIKLPRRFQWPQHPVGPARSVGRIFIGRPRHCQPFPINLARLCSVDMNVAVVVG